MEIRYDCPTDGCVAIIEYQPLEECGPSIECPRCHVKHEMTLSDAVRNEGIVDRCAVCGGSELFIRKDFPQLLGFAIVVVFGLVSLYFFQTNLITAWLVLLGAIVLDLIIYLIIGKVTACYACRAEYRGCVHNESLEGFDLATSEKY